MADNSRAATFIEPDDVVLLVVDAQPGLALVADSRPHQEFIDAVTAVVRLARLFDVPIVATTSARDRFSGPMFPQVTEHLESAPIERHVLDAWQDDNVRAAIEATGRKHVLVVGALTEACVAFPVLSMLAEGYRVEVIVDATAAITKETQEAAVQRMTQAGAGVATWVQLLLEWQQDWTHHDTYAGATGILTDLGGGYGLALHHAWEMLSSPAATPKTD